MGDSNDEGEWVNAYHGTKIENINKILMEGLKPGNRNCYGVGIYCSPNVETAAKYATTFEYENEIYKVVIQIRVKPDKIVECKEKGGKEDYWYIEDSENVRNFGILVKKTSKPVLSSNSKGIANQLQNNVGIAQQPNIVNLQQLNFVNAQQPNPQQPLNNVGITQQPNPQQPLINVVNSIRPPSKQFNYYLSSLPIIKADIHNIQLILNCIADAGLKQKIPELYNIIYSLPNQNPTNQNYDVLMNCITEMEYIRGYLKTLLQYYIDIVEKHNTFFSIQYLPLLKQNPIKAYDYCIAIKSLCDLKMKYEGNQPQPLINDKKS